MMKNSFITIPRSKIPRNQWDQFVDMSNSAWFWHISSVLDATSTWRGCKDESFVIAASNGQLLALVPLQRTEKKIAGIVVCSVLHSTGGPAYSNTLTTRLHLQINSYLHQHLLDAAHKGRCLEIRASLDPLTPNLRGALCPRVNPLLHVGAQSRVGQSWVVDLTCGIQALWGRLETRTRTSIRKAEKMGVTARLANQAGDVDTYYALHLETYSRTGARPHPKAYFEAIWQCPASQVWFAVLDKQVVAAANFGIFKSAAIYWTGAASSKGLTVSAPSLLQWVAMQSMVNNQLEWYETGEAFPGAMGKLRGLSDFKKGFGGQLYPYYRGVIPFKGILPLSYRLYQAI